MSHYNLCLFLLKFGFSFTYDGVQSVYLIITDIDYIKTFNYFLFENNKFSDLKFVDSNQLFRNYHDFLIGCNLIEPDYQFVVGFSFKVKKLCFLMFDQNNQHFFKAVEYPVLFNNHYKAKRLPPIYEVFEVDDLGL